MSYWFDSNKQSKIVGENMTAQKYCKSKGLTIQTLAEYTGLKPRRLFDWWNTQNKAFKVLVDGWMLRNIIDIS
jgi:hypothetical protein